ncbi:MAG: beta-lactamase family protein [Bacteroidales bacterium]|jgi:D-alanyl-D-alanine carboxypeptidase|nr:beta-lactamase family protein [Bacteroidales bacterium]
MKRIYLGIILLAIIVVSCKKTEDNQPVPVNNIEVRLQAIMDSIIKNTHVPGLVAGIWAPNENVSFIYTAGTSDLETNAPMNENMIFRIGSNTKTFTVTVLLQLVDEGKIALNDKLSDYLPDFPDADKVSIEMLTNMRSGIFNYSEAEEFFAVFVTDPTHFWTAEELIGIAKEYDYYFEPGTDFHYSNTNTIIIGQIVKSITGNSLESEIRSRIIDELNLVNTMYMIGGTEIPGFHPKGYYFGEYDPEAPECSELFDASWAGPAGGMISDIFELSAYAEALSGGYFLSDTLQNHRINCHEISGSDKKYGMGIFSYDNFYGHNGGYPGFTSLMMNSPDRNCTIIIWYNCQLSDADPTMLLSVVTKAIYPDL